MDSYIKTLKIIPEFDKSKLMVSITKTAKDIKQKISTAFNQSTSKLKNEMENLKINIKEISNSDIKKLDDKIQSAIINNIENQIRENISKLAKIEGEEYEQLKKETLILQQSLKPIKMKEKTDEFFKSFKNEGFKLLKKIGDSVVEFFKDLYNDAKQAIDEMASYNLGSSLVINSSAREQALKYGLSDAENYAFSKVKEEMGIQSEEDLFYMNESQRERFAERIGYYSNKYTELSNQDFFNSWQKYQIEMKEFKEEMVMDVAGFLVENKDTIKSFMKMGMDFMKTVVEILGWFMNALGSGERNDITRASATADIISSNSVSNINTQSVNQNNNYYGVDNSGSILFSRHAKWSFEQIKAALGGK